MTDERRVSNSMRTKGGTFTGSILSVGDRTTSTVYQQPSSRLGTVEDLRHRLLAERAHIIAAVPDPEDRAEVTGDLDRIIATLAQPAPDPARVRRRWSVVSGVLAGTAAVAKVVEDISGMVTALFPTS